MTTLKRGESWQRCIAHVLELPVEEVPNFIALGGETGPESWWSLTRRFVANHKPGLQIYWADPQGTRSPLGLNEALEYEVMNHAISLGWSPRGLDTAAVMSLDSGDVTFSPNELLYSTGASLHVFATEVR